VLDAERVLADEPALVVVDHRDGRRVGPDAVGLADAVDVLVRDHLDEHVVAAAQVHAVRQDVDDLHARLRRSDRDGRGPSVSITRPASRSRGPTIEG
jgi:hypothetical protein